MAVRLLVAAPLLAAAVFAGGASAGDPVQDRAAMIKAFNQMAAKNAGGGAGIPRLQVRIPEAAGGEARAMVKVWARKYDVDQDRVENELVALENTRWKPNEYFVLCFEAAAQVQFILYDLSTDENGNEVVNQILPSPKRPSSFKPIPAGQVYEMLFPLQTEDHRKDEKLRFAFFTADHPGLPPPPPPAEKDTGVLNIQAGNLKKVVARAQADGLKANGLKVGPPPKASTRDLNAVDDVAIILALKETGGVVEVTLRK